MFVGFEIALVLVVGVGSIPVSDSDLSVVADEPSADATWLDVVVHSCLSDVVQDDSSDALVEAWSDDLAWDVVLALLGVDKDFVASGDWVGS